MSPFIYKRQLFLPSSAEQSPELETSLKYAMKLRLQLRFDFDSTAIRRPFDCLSKVIKVTVT